MTRMVAGLGPGPWGCLKKAMEWGSPEISSVYIGESGRACQVLAMWDAGGAPGCVNDTQ